MEGNNMTFSGATSIYFNGNIYTVDKDFTKANALVIKNDRLIYVGTDEIAMQFKTENTKIIDLKGKTVLPGLIEGHTHFGWLSQSLIEIDALFKQKEEIIEEVRKKAAAIKPGTWILGRGWNNEIWNDTTFPMKEDLDAAAPNNPVCIIRTCCHAYWTNSKALELAKINKETPSPDGGEIIRNNDGSPTGVLVDNAGTQLMSIIPPYEGENQLKALMKGQEHLLSYGFTSIMDAGASIEEIAAMKLLCETEKMDLRLYVYAKEGETAEFYYKKGIEVGLYENHLTVRGIKFFADGSSGARRAYLWRDIIDAGLHIVNGSDAPVELVNPYHGFYAAVTRKGRDGQPEGGWYPNQCMTREEALKAATIWAAEAQFEENIKGSLEEGKLADFTVIDRDYMNCSIEEIKDINAEMTVVGGKTVYLKK